MKKLAPLLAWRYLGGSAYEQTVSTMVRICFISIMVGSFSLTVVTAVMRGFEVIMHEKMQGIHANLIIRSHGDAINVPALARVIRAEFPEIKAISQTTFGHAIIQTPVDDTTPAVVLLRGIAPRSESKVSTLAEKIIAPPGTTIEETVADSNVLVGKELAENLGVSVGDPIKLLYTDSEKIRGRKITLNPIDAHIGGIFDTGVEDFDSSVVFCSLDFFTKLLPDANITQVHASLKAGSNDRDVINRLRKRTGLEVFSWQDLYPAIVAALKLEKYVMFFILSLITLIASMNIVALLFMQINQKRPDIAILKAMGTPHRLITAIFMLIGGGITALASIVGIGAGILASYLLETHKLIKLPDAYYATHLPAHMSWQIAVSVFIVVVFLGLLATWFPTRAIRTINISRVLKYEG